MLQIGDARYQLDAPLVMGIVNVTPDSFFDGGKFFTAQQAITHAHQLIKDGADILDIGGESTRPGATAVTVADQLARVLPVVTALRDAGRPLSIDTQNPAVMRAAIDAGAAMVNDVNALRAPGAIKLCADANVSVCLMHRQGDPNTMQQGAHYADVVAEVLGFLSARAAACEAAGIARPKIIIDPGFGFGKSLEHNLEMLRRFDTFVAAGYTTLIGISRKSMFKSLLDRDLDQRLVPSVVAALLAVQRGAHILRVHDVRETCDALKLLKTMGSK